jgi:hypothetical protein
MTAASTCLVSFVIKLLHLFTRNDIPCHKTRFICTYKKKLPKRYGAFRKLNYVVFFTCHNNIFSLQRSNEGRPAGLDELLGGADEELELLDDELPEDLDDLELREEAAFWSEAGPLAANGDGIGSNLQPVIMLMSLFTTMLQL